MQIKTFSALIILVTATAVNANTAPLPFNTAIATMETSANQQVLNGVVEAINKATLSSQVSGRVTSVNFDIDDFVKKGSIILQVRDTEYKARLESAKATLAEARALQKDAGLEYNRLKGLFKDRVVSASNFDKAKAGLKAAEARVAASIAKKSEAQEQLDNTVVKAPYSGIVTKRFIEPGETIVMGQPIMAGFSMKKLRVNVDVPQSFANAIRKHKHAFITLQDSSKTTIKATNVIVFPFANAKTHTFKVRVNIADNTKHIYPGTLVKVSFLIDKSQRLLVPTDAIAHRSEVSAIYIVSDSGKVKLRQIREGRTFGHNTEILAGLDAGERIATDPVKAGVYLKDILENQQ